MCIQLLECFLLGPSPWRRRTAAPSVSSTILDREFQRTRHSAERPRQVRPGRSSSRFPSASSRRSAGTRSNPNRLSRSARPVSRLRDALKKLWPWSQTGGRARGGRHRSLPAASTKWRKRRISGSRGKSSFSNATPCALAADWAGKGLPRHDVARTAPLEVEQFLAGRCAETFRQWADRVRVTMRDRIAREAESIGDKLVDGGASTTRIDRLESEIAGVDRRATRWRLEAKEAAASSRVRSDLSGLAVLLVLRHRADSRRVLRQLPGVSPAPSDEAGARESRGRRGAGCDQRGLVGRLGSPDEGNRSARRRALRRAHRRALSRVVRQDHGRTGASARRAQTQGSATCRDDRSEHPATTPGPR